MNMDVQSTDNTKLSEDEIQRLNSLAVEVPIDEIVIGERIRRNFDHVPELASSIKEDGLIQPVVLTYGYQLIAGESRIRAHKLLGLSTIRAVFRGILDEAQLVVLEATENNARQNLTWQERVLSIDKVHRLRSTNAALSGAAWGVRETGALLNQAKSNIGRAVLVAEYLHANDQDIWKAETMQDAFRVLIRREEDRQNALIAKATVPAKKTTLTIGPATKFVGTEPPRNIVVPRLDDGDFFDNPFRPGVEGPEDTGEVPGAAPAAGLEVPLSEMLRHGKAEELIKDYANESFDHVITDWPYGIDMENFIQDVTTTAAEHGVDDNLSLHKVIVPEIYRVLKPKGFFVTWTDMANWQYHYDLCVAAGFAVQRWPLVWHKTSTNANQAAQYNFTKNYEIAIVCRKGGATLLTPQSSSVWTGGNDTEAKALGHPFAKPFGLWNWILDAVAVRGCNVLEPFAGRGSAVIPAIRRGLKVTAFECNEEHYNSLVVNVSNLYRSLDPNVKFV